MPGREKPSPNASTLSRLTGYATGLASNELGCDRRLTAYASTQAHSSIEKAVRIAGLGSDNLRKVAVDGDYALRPDELARAIREAHVGRPTLAPEAAQALIQARREPPGLGFDLTERECLAGVPSRTEQIAFDLGMSEKTVKVHRARVMDKMKAKSLADLVRMAEKIGQ